MTEAEMNMIRLQARSGDAKAEYELAVMYSIDYFKRRAIFTLRPLYQEILAELIGFINLYCPSESASRLEESVSTFRMKPSVATLDSLIGAIIVESNQNNPQNAWKVTQKLSETIQQLSNILPGIVEEHFPELQRQKDLETAVIDFSESPDISTLEALLSMLNAVAKKKGDGTLVLKLLADSAYKGHHPALQKLGEVHGIRTKDLSLKNEIIRPIMSACNNEEYPSVITGQYYPSIKLNGKSLKIPISIPLFDLKADPLNRFVTIRHDENSFESRKAGFAITQTLLSSIMAWAGPHGFSVDILDFDNSGIGAHAASFLPTKEIKILTKQDNWGKEIDDLGNLMDKRASKFSHFLQHNAANPDMNEPLKIVVVRDMFGNLISEGLEPSKETGLELRSTYETHKQQVERFSHLLRRGFQFGLIFIVNTSTPKVYDNASFSIDCTRDMSTPQDPFDCFGIEGVSSNKSDWLLKYLANGNGSEHRQKPLESTVSINDGIITTPVSEENTEAEFRMDTVNHIHAFVIGQSGSGKSRLLHNIITGLVTRYAPDDLMLYLLDLKMGGVELNRYRPLPHLRSLLVENNDIQIVLEIIRDIELMMRERGKALRKAKVSDVKEYNRAFPNSKMPQVVVFIDECHQIFSLGSSGSGFSKEQRTITECLSMIAKEGRSQGIHLIFATQTLSGSEIPSEIRKNITDFYFLKCSPSDSENLVRGSSNKTEILPLGGKVYYYHANKQLYFQGTFLEDVKIETIVEEVSKRHAISRGHGKLYFNGSQTFALDREIIKMIIDDTDGNIEGAVGRRINLQQDIVRINLKNDYAENVLMSGTNNEGQLNHTSMAYLASQIAAARLGGISLKIYAIDCSPNGSDISHYLQDLQNLGWISLFRPTDCEQMLRDLCNSVSNNSLITATMLYIIGQDRFGEMKRDQAFKNDTATSVFSEGDATSDLLFSGINFSDTSTANMEFNTYRKAINFLLENGPICGLHTLVQIDKPDNLLFEDYISAKMVSSKFKHIVLLKSDNRATMQLGLDDDLRPELLSADPERLRAYCYNDDSGETFLFSPFEQMKINDIESIIN